MYTLDGYGKMVADRVRVEAYAQALRQTVRPGSVVVDIGTGPGIFAVLACQLGASRVYAVEPDAIIQVARQIAAANRCAEKIEFIEDLSTQVTLPERADVIVSDMRGVLPLFGYHIPSIIDARGRFLAPGGILIPKKDTLWAAVAEAPERYGNIVNPWEQNILGQNLRPAQQMVVNSYMKARLTPQQLLTRPQVWTTLDYETVESPDRAAELSWVVERTGTGHGLVVWFATELVDGIGFSNAPGEPEAIYGRLFFPWMEPVPLATGQTVHVTLEAKLLEKEYLWRWITRIPLAGESGKEIHFDQSDLNGAVLSLAKLHKSGSDWIPELSEEGRVHTRALELMDGTASLETIAKRLAAEFPARFSRWHQALTYAGDLSKEYSR